MADPPLSQPPPPPPPRSTFPMLYYGLVVVAAAAVILVLYNLIVMKWCNHLSDQSPPPQRISRRRRRTIPAWRIENPAPSSAATFKYEGDGKGGDAECAVCLSIFDEGEEIRRLPKCKHYFHAPCIDMWLYSHMDCPLCRSPVEPPPPPPQLLRQPEESEHSREGLLPGGAALFV